MRIPSSYLRVSSRTQAQCQRGKLAYQLRSHVLELIIAKSLSDGIRIVRAHERYGRVWAVAQLGVAIADVGGPSGGREQGSGEVREVRAHGPSCRTSLGASMGIDGDGAGLICGLWSINDLTRVCVCDAVLYVLFLLFAVPDSSSDFRSIYAV